TGLILIVAVTIDQLTGARARGLWKLLTRTRNKKMERAINVALTLIILGLLAFWPRLNQGVASRNAGAVANAEADPNEEYVFIGKSVSNPYWVDAREGLEDRARALGVKADFRGASGTDVNDQIKQFEDAMARKPAGIIISPSGVGVTPMINRAIDSRIPVIC